MPYVQNQVLNFLNTNTQMANNYTAGINSTNWTQSLTPAQNTTWKAANSSKFYYPTLIAVRSIAIRNTVN